MGRSNFYSSAVLSTIQRNQEGTAELTSGFLQSLMWTIFFALCPVFFKMVANFGSKANSVANAELRALQYFWWFMVVSAFSSTLIANMVLFGFNEGNLGGELRSILRSIARAIPSTTAAMWLNWLIFRTTVTMPALYLLQVNSFLFDFFGFRCCSRLSRGGGECCIFDGSLLFEYWDMSHPTILCFLSLYSQVPVLHHRIACMWIRVSCSCACWHWPRLPHWWHRLPFATLCYANHCCGVVVSLSIDPNLMEAGCGGPLFLT